MFNKQGTVNNHWSGNWTGYWSIAYIYDHCQHRKMDDHTGWPHQSASLPLPLLRSCLNSPEVVSPRLKSLSSFPSAFCRSLSFFAFSTYLNNSEFIPSETAGFFSSELFISEFTDRVELGDSVWSFWPCRWSPPLDREWFEEWSEGKVFLEHPP